MDSKSGDVFWKSGSRHTEEADAVAAVSDLQETEVRPLEEWERLVRQHEAQSSDTLQDTIKAATLPHNPEDLEWRRDVGLNATRLQGNDALRKRCTKRTDNGAWQTGTTSHLWKLTRSRRAKAKAKARAKRRAKREAKQRARTSRRKER